MKCHPRIDRVIVPTFLALALGACGSAQPCMPPPPADGHRTIAEGYSLVYDIATQQQGLKKLLIIKSESDPVDEVLTEIADYTTELSAELEDIASRYPAISVETQFLPEVEVRTRESVGSETTKIFLATSGKDFERRVLLKQLGALEQEQHIAKVMVGLETADERREFWERTERRFGQLHAKVERLLEQRYFCQ